MADVERDKPVTRVAAAIGAASFNCPHCGALASQKWFSCLARHTDEPLVVGDEQLANAVANWAAKQSSIDPTEKQQAARILVMAQRLRAGQPVFDTEASRPAGGPLHNVFMSECFSCKKLCLWLRAQVLWPPYLDTEPPNHDLPEDIAADYREAALIVRNSPRGACALLRLCVQKLCIHLGEPGKNINDDIGRLVKKGLSPKIQRALDVVRVNGNNAVHPANLDLRDDVASALTMFGLVNLIADAMISQPRHVEDMFNRLPAGAKDAVALRDGDPPSKGGAQ